jgi:ABC-type lipoprotein release transport system permease subunit
MSRALTPMLYGGTTFSAWTVLAVVCALAPAVLFASAFPARRAVRIEPARALRQE